MDGLSRILEKRASKVDPRAEALQAAAVAAKGPAGVPLAKLPLPTQEEPVDDKALQTTTKELDSAKKEIDKLRHQLSESKLDNAKIQIKAEIAAEQNKMRESLKKEQAQMFERIRQEQKELDKRQLEFKMEEAQHKSDMAAAESAHQAQLDKSVAAHDVQIAENKAQSLIELANQSAKQYSTMMEQARKHSDAYFADKDKQYSASHPSISPALQSRVDSSLAAISRLGNPFAKRAYSSDVADIIQQVDPNSTVTGSGIKDDGYKKYYDYLNSENAPTMRVYEDGKPLSDEVSMIYGNPNLYQDYNAGSADYNAAKLWNIFPNSGSLESASLARADSLGLQDSLSHGNFWNRYPGLVSSLYQSGDNSSLASIRYFLDNIKDPNTDIVYDPTTYKNDLKVYRPENDRTSRYAQVALVRQDRENLKDLYSLRRQVQAAAQAGDKDAQDDLRVTNAWYARPVDAAANLGNLIAGHRVYDPFYPSAIEHRRYGTDPSANRSANPLNLGHGILNAIVHNSILPLDFGATNAIVSAHSADTNQPIYSWLGLTDHASLDSPIDNKVRQIIMNAGMKSSGFGYTRDMYSNAAKSAVDLALASTGSIIAPLKQQLVNYAYDKLNQQTTDAEDSKVLNYNSTGEPATVDADVIPQQPQVLDSLKNYRSYNQGFNKKSAASTIYNQQPSNFITFENMRAANNNINNLVKKHPLLNIASQIFPEYLPNTHVPIQYNKYENWDTARLIPAYQNLFRRWDDYSSDTAHAFASSYARQHGLNMDSGLT